MLQLFVPNDVQELAAFLRKARSLRFPRVGALSLPAQAATCVTGLDAGHGLDADDDGTRSDDDSDDE